MLVFFDIDGVLADCSHRLHYAKEKNYDMFYSPTVMAGDRPIKDGFELLNMFWKSDATVWFFTGRPERTRNITEEWLKMYLPEVMWYRFIKTIVMRKDGDYRPSPIVKREMFDRMNIDLGKITATDEPVFFVDDDPENVKRLCDDFRTVTGIVFGAERLK